MPATYSSLNVHTLASLKPTHAVADVVRELKKCSSAWASKRYARFAWKAGYSASAYIAGQERHHRKVGSAAELRELLVEYGIEIDERFFE